MKIKCPHCDGKGWYVISGYARQEDGKEDCANCYGTGCLENVEIPTADLVIELNERRPVSCQPCINKSKNWYCAGCFWV